MPNWVSWAAHSHLPLPTFRTYSVVSLVLFLCAVFNCSFFSALSFNDASESLLHGKNLDFTISSWVAGSVFSSHFTTHLESTTQNSLESLYDYFDVAHLEELSVETFLSELSKKYPGGFPKAWTQLPLYFAFLLQNSFVVWVCSQRFLRPKFRSP